jgi:hypothetical protein
MLMVLARLIESFQVAEELYQAGFISYPRTETDSFTGNTDLHVGVIFAKFCSLFSWKYLIIFITLVALEPSYTRISRMLF